MPKVFASIGSNLDDRVANVKCAIRSLELLHMTKLVSVSSFYETEPVGTVDAQIKYINCCVKLETELTPHVLMGAFLGIESAMGRIRTFKNASRIIDIDLLLYDDLIINTDELVLPHPRMFERDFVIIPLSEIR